MNLAKKLITVAENVPRVYEAGRAKTAAEYDARYYVTTVKGSGTPGLSLTLPWMPDFVRIAAVSSRAYALPSYVEIRKDFRLFSNYVGRVLLILSAGGAPQNGNITADSEAAVMDGNTFVFTPSASAVYQSVSWRADCDYLVTAVKYTDKTDVQLLEAEIAALGDGGGTLTLSQKRINETVTDEQWAALIAPAQEKGWTFTLV